MMMMMMMIILTFIMTLNIAPFTAQLAEEKSKVHFWQKPKGWGDLRFMCEFSLLSQEMTFIVMFFTQWDNSRFLF